MVNEDQPPPEDSSSDPEAQSHVHEEVEPESPTADTEEKDGNLGRTVSNVSVAETLSPFREFLFVGVITLAQFTTQVGLGQTLAITHVIGDYYGLDNPGDLAWLIAGYSLTVGTFILVSGRFGDLFGYKKMLLIGFAWFALWSLVAGLAAYSNYVLFIFARVLQGIGPSICLPNGLAILGSTYAPGRKKDMAFSIFGAAAPGGSIVGAAFAGIFAELVWWPWTFFSFAIALVFTGIIGYFCIPDPPQKRPTKKRSLWETIIQLDPLGCITGVVALVLINFAWNQSGVTGWQEPYVYVCLILGFLIVFVFFYIELRVSTAPLIPFEALTSDVSFVLGCIACGWGSFGIWVYYIWNFLEELRLGSPLQVTAWLCPVAISGAIASVSTGLLLSKIRPAWVMTLALLGFLIGNILMATAPVEQTYWAQTFVCVLVIPWGMDMSFPAGTLILSNAVAKKHQGIAASLVNTVVNYSISLALGFAGTVEANVNNGGTTRADVLKGYRGAWYMAIGLSSLGLMISLLFVLKGNREDRRHAKSGKE